MKSRLPREFALAFVFWACAATAFAESTVVLPLSGMGEKNEKPVYWDFKLDAGRGSGQWKKIQVPSCWEQQGFGAYYYGGQGRHKPDDDPIIPKETAIYRRAFELPASWRERDIHVVFEGVMTDATVRINGQLAGPTHQGGFYRFTYRITDFVKAGQNEIEVEVSKESKNKSVNFAERRGDYWTFGGIYRPVWLEARPVHHIEWTAIDARADGSFYAQAHLSAETPANTQWKVELVDSRGAHVASIPGQLLYANTVVFRGKVSDPRTWTAESPHLYEAIFHHAPPGQVSHELRQRFGFRTLEVRPRDGVYLNGTRIVLKGINRHSFRADSGRTLTREENWEDARLIKQANMNAVRMSHYPPDPAFLEAADELGLYVLDELAGWQGYYDTPTGARLIGQIVRRDVNHPSILFWDNGNEGGWNRENDGQFDLWDPQRRPVLHPWGIHGGIDTDHYENYESTVRLSGGPNVFMPTEFLHGLYDGGIGAGLFDYWEVMKRSPTVAGGFFWVFADEGIARTDQGGRIDNMGNLAPDGMLGARHEKEGSYFAVKELWSPVELSEIGFSQGEVSMRITNWFDFTDLNRSSVRWRVRSLPQANQRTDASVRAEGVVPGPDLSPRSARRWQFKTGIEQLGANEVLELIFFDSAGEELWTWTLPGDFADESHGGKGHSPIKVSGNSVQAGKFTLQFDAATGELARLSERGQSIELRGPRLSAWRRVAGARNYELATGPPRLLQLDLNPDPQTVARARYEGALKEVRWRLRDNQLEMDFSLDFRGPIDILGVKFDYPREKVHAKRWVGEGPYRIWKNRAAGTWYGLHSRTNLQSNPGQTYAYPEFEGFFGAWRWMEMQTMDGRVAIENLSGVPHFGLYAPALGDKPIIELPDSGWSFLQVIPPIGTKFDLPNVLGPQSQSTNVEVAHSGSLRITLSR